LMPEASGGEKEGQIKLPKIADRKKARKGGLKKRKGRERRGGVQKTVKVAPDGRGKGTGELRAGT